MLWLYNLCARKYLQATLLAANKFTKKPLSCNHQYKTYLIFLDKNIAIKTTPLFPQLTDSELRILKVTPCRTNVIISKLL